MIRARLEFFEVFWGQVFLGQVFSSHYVLTYQSQQQSVICYEIYFKGQISTHSKSKSILSSKNIILLHFTSGILRLALAGLRFRLK